MSKRVFIAALGTETNQFVPFPTGRRGYEEHGVWRGDATRHQPTNFTAPLHVWRKLAEERGWTVIEGLATFAAPSGTTVRSVYEGFRDEVLAGVKAAQPLDAVLINVHGAMVADGYDDCEGDLLTRVRAIVGPEVAIGAEFDLHCHLSALMLKSTDVLVGYKEYPHTNSMERAAELFAIVADTADGKVKPVMARHDCRMIAQYRTSVPPISEFVVRMKSFEGKDGILSVSLSHGFSFADVEDVNFRSTTAAGHAVSWLRRAINAPRPLGAGTSLGSFRPSRGSDELRSDPDSCIVIVARFSGARRSGVDPTEDYCVRRVSQGKSSKRRMVRDIDNG